MSKFVNNIHICCGVLLVSIVSLPTLSGAGCISGDCAALGYASKAADCPNGKVLCPFDTDKAFCASVTYGEGNQVVSDNKIYLIKDAGISGTTYAQAVSACQNIGYSLPENTNVIYEVTGNKTFFDDLSLDFDVSGKDSGAHGYYSQDTGGCSASQRRTAYLNGPQCVEDTRKVNQVICVKVKS